MKYCRYCGKQLEDDQICDCQKQGNDIKAADKKNVKNKMQFDLEWFRKLDAQKKMILTLVLSFMSILLYHISFYMKVGSSIGGALNGLGSLLGFAVSMFNIGRVFMTSLLVYLILIGGYILIFIIIMSLKKVSLQIEALMQEIYIYILDSSCVFVLGAILMMLSPLLGIVCFIGATIYLLVTALSYFFHKNYLTYNHKDLVIMTAIILVYVLILSYICMKLLVWNFNVM